MGNGFEFNVAHQGQVQRGLGLERSKGGRLAPDVESLSYHGDLRNIRLPGQGLGSQLHEGSSRKEPEDISHRVQRIPGKPGSLNS